MNENEHESLESLGRDDPRIVDAELDGRVHREGETLPRWGRYITVFEETVALKPTRRLRAATASVDLFNAGAEQINRHLARFLYRSVINGVKSPGTRELLREVEDQRILRRMGQMVLRLGLNHSSDEEPTRTPDQ